MSSPRLTALLLATSPRLAALLLVATSLLTAQVATAAPGRPPHAHGLHLVRGRFQAPATAVAEVQRQGRGAGTAFLIRAGADGEAWVMTNHHVVWDAYNEQLSEHMGRPDLSLRFERGGRSVEVHPTRYVYTSESLDVAILAFRTPAQLQGVSPLRLLDRAVRAGEGLCAIGYPSLPRGSGEASGWWCAGPLRSPAFRDREDSRWAPGVKMLALGRELNQGRPATDPTLPRAPLIRHSAITFHGSSGSPLLVEGGVIALESRGDLLRRGADRPPPSHGVAMSAILGALRRGAPEVYRELAPAAP